MGGNAELLPEAPWLFDSDQVFARLRGMGDVWAAAIALAQLCALFSNTAAEPSEAHEALAMAEALRVQLPPLGDDSVREPRLLDDLPRFEQVAEGPVLSKSLLVCARRLVMTVTAERPTEAELSGAVAEAASVLRALAVTTNYMASLRLTLRSC